MGLSRLRLVLLGARRGGFHEVAGGEKAGCHKEAESAKGKAHGVGLRGGLHVHELVDLRGVGPPGSRLVGKGAVAHERRGGLRSGSHIALVDARRGGLGREAARHGEEKEGSGERRAEGEPDAASGSLDAAGLLGLFAGHSAGYGIVRLGVDGAHAEAAEGHSGEQRSRHAVRVDAEGHERASNGDGDEPRPDDEARGKVRGELGQKGCQKEHRDARQEGEHAGL